MKINICKTIETLIENLTRKIEKKRALKTDQMATTTAESYSVKRQWMVFKQENDESEPKSSCLPFR